MRSASVISSILLVFSGLANTPDEEDLHDLISNSKEAFDGFLENKGQWHDDVRFIGGSSDQRIHFLRNGLSFSVGREIRHEDSISLESINWNVLFKNINPAAKVSGVNGKKSNIHFFKGNDPAKHVQHTPQFEKINYDDIYTGIDVQYYLTKSGLKYDYIIKPDGNIGDIQLDFQGVESIQLARDGKLVIKHLWGEVVEAIPYSFQTVNGRKKFVDVKYVMLEPNRIGFQVTGNYDKNVELIIDPIVEEWGTFMNATMLMSNTDYCHNHYVDSAGYVYITGMASSSSTATAGAAQTGYGGGVSDVFLAKILPDGSDVEYITFLGGDWNDEAYDVVALNNGEAYITGYTASSDYPMAGIPISASNSGVSDVVLSKLSSDGSTLIYSTHIGGLGADGARGIEINDAEEIWITGSSQSADFPTTAGSYDQILDGTSDAFVLKMTTAGGILYSTFVGGSLTDFGRGLDVNGAGEAFIYGRTNSVDFPIAGAAHDAGFNGVEDIFISKLNASGTGPLLYSTYVGGSGIDRPFELKLNGSDDIYLTGHTESADFPTSPTAYDQVLDGLRDAFVLKLDISNPTLIFSTFLGGGGGDQGYGLDLTESGDIFVTGFTTSGDFPFTSCAIISSFQGESDMYISMLNPDGSQLYFSTYFGGAKADYGQPRVTFTGDTCSPTLVVSGTSHSIDFPATVGSYNNVHPSGGGDVHVAFKLAESYNFDFAFATNECTVTFTDNLSGICSFKSKTWSASSDYWTFGDGDTSFAQNPVHTYAGSGTYLVSMFVGCPVDTVMKSVVVNCCELSMTASSDALCSGGIGATALVTGQGTGPWDYEWNDGNTTTQNIGLPGADSIVGASGNYTVIVTDASGCQDTIQIAITEPTALLLIDSATTATCGLNDGSAAVEVSGGTPGYAYLWTTNQTTDSITGLAAGTYWVVVADTNGCKDSISAVVQNFPQANLILSADSNQCFNDSSGLAYVDSINGTGPFTYSWSPSGDTDSIATDLTAGTHTVTVMDANGCITVESVDVGGPTALSVSATFDSSHCNQSDGQAIVIYSGGTTPSSPIWNDPAAQVGDTAFNLPAGVYEVVITDANGCKDSVSLTIPDIPGPTLGIDSVAHVSCNGECNALAWSGLINPGTGSYDLIWSPTGGTDFTTGNLCAGAYTVTITDAAGCTDQVPIVITEPTELTGSVATVDASCGVSDGQATASPAGGVSPYTYSWDSGGAQSANFVDTFGLGTHLVVIYDSLGCDTTLSFTIGNPNAPSLSVNQTASILCFGDANASATANPAGGTPPYTYLWDTLGQATQTISGIGPGTYAVAITDSLNCQSTDSITISEPPLLVASADSVNAFCDMVNGSAEADAFGGTNPLTYQWNYLNLTTPAIANLPAGTYIVVVTDGNNCQTTDTVSVNLASNLPNVLAWPDTAIQLGESVQVNSSGGDTCLWIPSAGLSNPNDCNPIATPTETTTYIVTVTKDNCESSDTITIVIDTEDPFSLYIPDAFTPNKDGVNDLFNIKGAGINDYRLQIFDRWGELIFVSVSIQTSWDGLAYDKKAVQEDTYIYSLSVSPIDAEPLEYLGRVSVIR